MEHFSSVCLSKVCLTHAFLALSGNIPLLKLLLTTMANGLLQPFGDSFISFGEMISLTLVDFLLSIFI